MKNESKSNLIAIFGSLGATGIFFAIVLIMGENSVAITIGLVIALPIFIYSIAKSVEFAKKDQQPIVSSVTQITSITWHGGTIPDMKKMLSNMPKQPILLSPNEGFMYRGMYEAVLLGKAKIILSPLIQQLIIRLSFSGTHSKP